MCIFYDVVYVLLRNTVLSFISNFIVTGNLQGFTSLYDYERRKRIVCRKIPPLPDFRTLLDKEAKKGTINYVTCPQSHEKLIAVTALKYSPIGESFVNYDLS